MTIFARATFIASVAAAMALPITPASAIFIRGVGAPPHISCLNAGGTMNGTSMCDLPDGRSCEVNAFAKDSVCLSAEGEILPPPGVEEDVGTNDGSDKSGDSE